MTDATARGVLHAAALYFAENGFHGAGFDGLTQVTGADTTSLLETYGSKEGLFYAALDYSREALEPEVQRRMVASIMPRARKAVLNPKLRIFHKETIERLKSMEGGEA